MQASIFNFFHTSKMLALLCERIEVVHIHTVSAIQKHMLQKCKIVCLFKNKSERL